MRRRRGLLAFLVALGFARPALCPASAAAQGTPVVHADAGAPAPLGMTEEEAAPPPEPEPPPVTDRPIPKARPGERTEHVVVPGDSLIAIAQRYGITVAALTAANAIGREARLRVGERLVIPAKGEIVKTPSRVHVVAEGNTLGGIARRYGTTIERILEANHMLRTDRLKLGAKLVIPGDTALPKEKEKESFGAEEQKRVTETADPGMQEMQLPGSHAPAYYFEPTGPGRAGMRPVIVYLHGRGAEPRHYCKRWARVARNLGWLICPSGPEDRGDGKRGWNNNWYSGRHLVMNAIEGLRKKYGRRVQLWGNVLVGFSEGAFVAMNVGLREPQTFNRWLILGADTDYWGAAGVNTLPEAKGRVKKVYLITGRRDDVVGDADKVRRWLTNAGVPVRVATPNDMGHEVALESKPAMYQSALRWLSEG